MIESKVIVFVSDLDIEHTNTKPPVDKLPNTMKTNAGKGKAKAMLETAAPLNGS